MYNDFPSREELKNRRKTIDQVIVEQAKLINLDDIDFEKTNNKKDIDRIEESKSYIWIRLMLYNTIDDLNVNDEVLIEYTNGEKLSTKFIAYSKKNLIHDSDNYEDIAEYDMEDDTKTLCLMIDESLVNGPKSIKLPFIRTLFPNSIYYQISVIRKEELTFTIVKDGRKLDYYTFQF